MENGMKKSEKKGATAEKSKASGHGDDRAYRLPSGLRRTLSTELVTKQAEQRTLMEVNGLVESRTWAPGEVLIRKGDTNRDLFFLTKGVVEIRTEEKTGSLVLNEIQAPYMIGDVAFLSGLPRTATVIAKTQATSFILKYENFMNICNGTPEWLSPLLSTFASGIKGLHYKIAELQDRN
jgi:CRP-like cAMP-binding protein